MKIELIPVIEFGGKLEDRINHKMQRCVYGPFYRLSDIRREEMVEIVKYHLENYIEGGYKSTDICPLFGGFVLNIDGKDMSYPQCCGNLGDIAFWTRISKGEHAVCQGHPDPWVEFEGSNVILDFTHEEDDSFYPEPPVRRLHVDMFALKEAVDEVTEYLIELGALFKEINEEEKLGVDDVDDLLIWKGGFY